MRARAHTHTHTQTQATRTRKIGAQDGKVSLDEFENFFLYNRHRFDIEVRAAKCMATRLLAWMGMCASRRQLVTHTHPHTHSRARNPHASTHARMHRFDSREREMM